MSDEMQKIEAEVAAAGQPATPPRAGESPEAHAERVATDTEAARVAGLKADDRMREAGVHPDQIDDLGQKVRAGRMLSFERVKDNVTVSVDELAATFKNHGIVNEVQALFDRALEKLRGAIG